MAASFLFSSSQIQSASDHPSPTVAHLLFVLLALTQICSVTAITAILTGPMDLQLGELAGAEFWAAGSIIILGALATETCQKQLRRGLGGGA